MELNVQDLSFSYSPQVIALKNINLKLTSGSFLGIAGPNGSGKSTLLKLVCGLISEKKAPGCKIEGSIQWDGQSIENLSRRELGQRIAFIPGFVVFRFPVNVFEFVMQGRYSKSHSWRAPTKIDKEFVIRALIRTGIEGLAAKLVNELSSGQIQLVLLARALAQNPKVLVLDEATTNLDLSFQIKVQELLGELNKAGLTILSATHDLHFAAQFYENILWLKQGQIYANGKVTEHLTNRLVSDLYGVKDKLKVGENPFSKRPTVFWN